MLGEVKPLLGFVKEINKNILVEPNSYSQSLPIIDLSETTTSHHTCEVVIYPQVIAITWELDDASIPSQYQPTTNLNCTQVGPLAVFLNFCEHLNLTHICCISPRLYTPDLKFFLACDGWYETEGDDTATRFSFLLR